MTTAASADYDFLGTTTDPDGGTVDWYRDDSQGMERTKWIIFLWDANHNSLGTLVFNAGDTGPDDPDNGNGQKPDVVGGIKKGTIRIVDVRANLEDTPLAKWLDAYGGGAAPHWNPGDGGNDSGPATPPVRKNNGPTLAQTAAAARLANLAVAELQGIGASMGDVDGLVGETGWSIPTTKGSGSNKGNGTNSNSSNKNNGIRHIFGSDLSVGPRPAVVNPPHSKTGTNRNLFAPGLLDRSSGLNAQGPSGAGALLGGGSSTRGGPAAAGH